MPNFIFENGLKSLRINLGKSTRRLLWPRINGKNSTTLNLDNYNI